MRIVQFWKPVGWIVVILALSLVPGNRLPGVALFVHSDKLVHALMYFGLAVLLVKPVKTFRHQSPYLIVFLVCVILGMLVELAQFRLVSGRSGSWPDGLANGAGAILGIVIYHTTLKGTRLERWI